MTMILSSADILRVLGGSEIIRLSARLTIADAKPSLSGAEGLFIYVSRFPALDEFEATWTLWIESDGSEPDDLVIEELRRLLPGVKVESGLLTTVTTTDFRSENTQTAPEAPKPVQASSIPNDYEDRFQSLLEDVQDQMLMVHSGTPGKDGRDGKDGLDGRDAEVGEIDLFDLGDCDRGTALQKGQVLTWNGSGWTNLYVPQISAILGGGGSGDGEGSGSSTLANLLDTETTGAADGDILIYNASTGNWTAGPGEQGAQGVGVPPGGSTGQILAKVDGTDYNTAWVDAPTGSGCGGGSSLPCDGILDGGNADDGTSDGLDGYGCTGILDGGNADDGTSDGLDCYGCTGILDGGNADDGTSSGVECEEGGIEEAPQDGNYYVRQNGAWVSLAAALSALDYKTIDGGNLTTGLSAGDEEAVDGGSFTP